MKKKANKDGKLLPPKRQKKATSWTLSRTDKRFLRSCNIFPQ